jgi:hypothetical protein
VRSGVCALPRAQHDWRVFVAAPPSTLPQPPVRVVL